MTYTFLRASAWKDALQKQATDEGREVLSEHALFTQFRSAWLTVRGRQALQEGRPKQSEAYLKAVTDDERVTPPPSAWVLRAEIALRAGDSAQAKRHLENILDQQPSVYSTLSTLDTLVLTEKRIAEPIEPTTAIDDGQTGEPAKE